MQKSDTLFGRDEEWRQLTGFLVNAGAEPRLALVYGRRRQGKSLLLTTLCAHSGGFYWEAIDGEATQNLASLSATWTTWTRSSIPTRFASWDEALGEIMSASDIAGRHVPVVLDEIPRVIHRVAEFPSLLQQALGPGRLRSVERGTSLILCGSAFGDMRRLIDGAAPLRGRATIELLVQPFDFRAAADFWGLAGNAQVAFAHNALIGGTPAYRSLADNDSPTDGDLNGWVVRRLLEPSSSLFREGRIVVAEDQQLGDQQRYWGLLAAIADGARRWSDLEDVLGQHRGSLRHALNVVIDAGWVVKLDDPLRANRATYSLAEPMIRFHRLVIEPNMQRLAARRGVDVWRDARPIVASQILGAHLEHLAIEWVVRHADPSTIGGALGIVGPTRLDGEGSPRQIETQLDLAGIEFGPRGGRRPIFVAEVKATEARVGASELDRLDRAVERIGAIGRCHRLLFSRSGFTTDLERLATRRPEVQLIDLHRLYTGS